MKLIRNKHFSKFVGLLLVDGLMFGLTNPDSIPSFGLMAGFLLLTATLYYVVSHLVSFAGLYGIKIRRKRRAALVITGVAAALVALQSMGELNSLDIAVSLPLVAITYIYSSYNRRAPAYKESLTFGE